MSEIKKIPYKSAARDTLAAETKACILNSAKNLFESEGFEYVTIEKIAQGANVSIPTIYSLFQSKIGVLRALMDDACCIAPGTQKGKKSFVKGTSPSSFVSELTRCANFYSLDPKKWGPCPINKKEGVCECKRENEQALEMY